MRDGELAQSENQQVTDLCYAPALRKPAEFSRSVCLSAFQAPGADRAYAMRRPRLAQLVLALRIAALGPEQERPGPRHRRTGFERE